MDPRFTIPLTDPRLGKELQKDDPYGSLAINVWVRYCGEHAGADFESLPVHEWCVDRSWPKPIGAQEALDKAEALVSKTIQYLESGSAEHALKSARSGNICSVAHRRSSVVVGKIIESVPVGPKPRFLTAGGGSVWTLNQGDGTISRVDEKSRKVIATIQVGIPGAGGDIGYGADSVWATVFDVPLTRIDASTNKVVRQWVGNGGDSLRYGFGSIWLTDYKKGLLSRFPAEEVLNH